MLDDYAAQRISANRVHRRVLAGPPFLAVLLLSAFSLAGLFVGGAQAATFEFPSSASTVISSGGTTPGQVGSFWSKARGDEVSQTFAGPSYIDHATLTVQPASNTLKPKGEVDWTLSINGVDVGSFVVPAESFTPIVLDRSFPLLAGPGYAAKIRVTNETVLGGGAVSLFSTGGAGSHSLDLSNTAAPDTALSSGPEAVTTATSASFAFSSPQADATGFQCSLDHTSFVPCVSPKLYSALAAGPHSFEVSAIDAAGNVDSSPAGWQWTVVASNSGKPVVKSHKCKKGFKRTKKHGKSVCVRKKHHKPKHRHH